MNSNPLLNRFLKLVEYDQSLRSIENNLLEIVDEIIDIEDLKKDVVVKIEKLKEYVHNWRKKVDLKEREMNEIDTLVTNVKSKMQLVTTSREYEIVRKELERMNQARNTLEDELLVVWNSFENAQKTVKKEEKFIEEKLKELDGAFLEKNEKKIALEADLSHKVNERLIYEVDIPRNWIDDYVRIKRLFLNPVVVLENGACSACYQMLSARQLSDLAKKQLYTCPGCFRFLYNT